MASKYKVKAPSLEPLENERFKRMLTIANNSKHRECHATEIAKAERAKNLSRLQALTTTPLPLISNPFSRPNTKYSLNVVHHNTLGVFEIRGEY